MAYFYPEVYVEGVDSEKSILQLNNEYVLTSRSDLNPRRRFGYIVFEEALRYIDLTTPRLLKSIIVLYGRSGSVYNGILVEECDEISLQVISGKKPFVTVNEGERVDINDKIGYVVTDKNEVRTIKSEFRGYVVLIINVTWEKPEAYVVVLVGENGYRPIVVREGP